MARMTILALAAAMTACVIVSGAAAQSTTPDYAALITAADRSPADRETDKRRDPVKLLAFTGVRTGERVLDMGAGGGYSTELLARAVGPNGVVYGQNSPDFGEGGKPAFEASTKTPARNPTVGLAS